MYAPRTQQGFHAPRSLAPVLLGLFAVLATLAAWAVFSTRSTSNESSYAGSVRPAPASVGSVAYGVSRNGFEYVYVRRADGSAPPRLVARFEVLNWRLRGTASPMADRLALVRADSIEGRTGRLTLLAIATGESIEAPLIVDYPTELAWSPDGTRLAAVRTASGGEGRTGAAVLEYSAAAGAMKEVAFFEGALTVAPVGYTIDGERLLAVVVDQSGSSLWAVNAGTAERLVRFSPGPTAQWSLGPDGSRLAFIDRIGVGGRTFAGKVLVIATGTVTEAPAKADQVGAAWRPGAAVPDFGGPGGSLQLTSPQPDGYVIPVRWSPDGQSLVAAIYTPAASGSPDLAPAFELVTAVRRTRLAEEDGAVPFGWVSNLD